MMSLSLEEMQSQYIDISEIVRDSGAERGSVNNWLRYHRFMPYTRVFGRIVVLRTDYEQFKRDHPERLRCETCAEARS